MRAFNTDLERETVGAPTVTALVENRVYIAREDLGVVMIELESPMNPLPWLAGRPTVHAQVFGPGSRAASSTLQIRLSDIDWTPSTAQAKRGQEISMGYTTASASIVPDSSATAPELAARLEAGMVVIRISGLPGQIVRVQRGPGLADEWTTFQTLTLGETFIELTEQIEDGADQSFFRAVSP